MFDVISYVMSKSYTDKSILGISGALAGKNCTIESANKVDGVTTIVFKWTADDGTVNRTNVYVDDGVDGVGIQSIAKTSTSGLIDTYTITYTDGSTTTYTVRNGKDGEDGISVTNAEIDASNHLIITLSDSTTIDCGEIKGATNLNELLDVDLSATLANGQVLTYNATTEKWENKELDIAVNIEDLEDVLIATPTDGQILVYDATNNVWKNQDNEVVADIDDLGDVDIDNATLENGQILKYDSVTQKWVNGNASATSTKIEDLADVSVDSSTLEDGQVLVYDATNQVWINQQGGGVIDELGDIGDVNLSSLTDGQIIVWNALAQKWINADIATNLSELTDVSLGALTNLDLLRYNLTRQRWENYQADDSVTENSVNVVTSGATFTAIKTVVDKLGDLTTLKTTDKTTVVNALNEVYDALVELSDNVGDITLLTTTDKTSVVNAINELVTVINSLKYLEQVTIMPLASDKPNKTVQYLGSDSVDYKRGYVYRSTPHVEQGEVVYVWERIDVQPNNDNYESLSNKPQINNVELVGDKSLNDLGIQRIMQYSVMPTPSVDYSSGICVQYLGNTTDTLKTGYFYVCKYITEDAEYKWVNVDVSSNTELAQRLTTVENNIGDMSTISIAGVTDLVNAINVLAVRGIKIITYTEPYLNIVLADDTTFSFDIRVILNATDIGDLGNVIDTTIQNGELLAYDTSILKYKPYNVVNALTATLQSSKDYTDQQIASAVQEDAFICDDGHKPTCTYDSSSGQYIVVYYQNNTLKTTTAISSRFYYKDSNGDPYCVSWFVTGDPSVDPVEFEYLVSTPDFDDYVNKNTDIVNTYSPDMVDKTKVPDIASLDALYALVANALSAKTNVADIVDNLLSDDATVPLSAKQGKVLKGLIDEKQNVLQMSVMPQCTQQMVTDNVVLQYIGTSSLAYEKGYWYEAKYNENDDIYYWSEIKYSPDMVEITTAEVDNLWN